MAPVHESLATPEGTARYARRFPRLAPGHFRERAGLKLSSIGIGTYLGDQGPGGDPGYVAAVRRAVELGCNVLDTAINYRSMRSERAIGKALAESFASGHATRDEVFVCTKGGFVPSDGDERADPVRRFRREYVEPGIAAPSDLVAGCHCLAPRYLEDQIDRSRANLGLGGIDLYYVHNPETQLSELPRDEFDARLLEVFRMLERKAHSGVVGTYGLATWNGFRAGPDEAEHLSLEAVLRIAAEAAEAESLPSHHFAGVELPLNLAMAEALSLPVQAWRGRRVPFLEAAREAGLFVATSASILQGKLARGLPAFMHHVLEGPKTDAQRALQFSRSCPGVTTALVGMSRPAHVEENLELATVEPADADHLRMLFEGPGRAGL